MQSVVGLFSLHPSLYPPYVPGAASCRGGWPEWAMEYVISNGGVDTEASYPYVAHVSDA